MSEKVSTELPQPSQIDLVYNAVGAAIASIPGVGPAAEAFFKMIVSEPLQKRREKWLTDLALGLWELQKRVDGFNPANLQNNENFIDVVSSAIQAAMKTHNQARREALKNAVLNSAAGMTVDDVLLGKFMRLIEEFTEVHIRILSVLANPGNFPKCHAKVSFIKTHSGKASKSMVIRAEIPEDEISYSVFKIVFEELDNANLIEGQGFDTVCDTRVFPFDGSFLLAKRTTEIGDQFFKFITKPDLCDK